MTIDEAKEVFFISRRARNLSKNTVVWYNFSLSKLFLHFEKNNLKNISDVHSSHIEYFLLELRKENLKDITIRDHFNIYRIFFTYLYDFEYIDRNPMKCIRPPKVEQKIMRTFTQQEIHKILKSFDTSNFYGLRNYLIMCLIFSTGARSGEVIGIKMADINITTDVIKIRGKGNKERIIPIGNTLRRALLRYIKERTDFLNDAVCEYLIVGLTKRQLTKSGMLAIFVKLKEELNIEGERVSPHTFRHSFAKNALLNGMDIFSLQRLMGHSSLNTTKKYIHLNDREVKQQHSKYNPLDNSDWQY